MTSPVATELCYEQVHASSTNSEYSDHPDFGAASPLLRIVAEGASGFLYPLGLDILDNLKANITTRFSRSRSPAIPLENMVYGTNATPAKLGTMMCTRRNRLGQ
jgi:hypothetical protein